MSRLDGCRILLTGASGGIGRVTALELAGRGARLAMAARGGPELEAAATAVREKGTHAVAIPCDLTDSAVAEGLLVQAEEHLGGVDVVISAAGMNAFGPHESVSAGALDVMLKVNVLAPMLLARAALPRFKERGSGHIVHLGSVFGSLPFPWYAAYSASKAALRGFSDALRREVEGSGIHVTLIAPRGVRTPMNNEIYAMAKATGMTMDPPERVAGVIADAVESRPKEVIIGFPESLFARLGSALPRVMDGALRSETEKMRPFAEEAARRRAEALPQRTPEPEPVTPGGAR